jgi:hypothetical protein
MDNIKIDVRELGCDGIEWTGLDQDRDRWAEVNIHVS